MTDVGGLPAYEISNRARPGEESRHNLAYWRYQNYLGIGPGAHGRRGGCATQRHRKPENWLSALQRNGHGVVDEVPIDSDSAAVEALLMGLRLREGIESDRIEWLGNAPFRSEERSVGNECVRMCRSRWSP